MMERPASSSILSSPAAAARGCSSPCSARATATSRSQQQQQTSSFSTLSGLQRPSSSSSSSTAAGSSSSPTAFLFRSPPPSSSPPSPLRVVRSYLPLLLAFLAVISLNGWMAANISLSASSSSHTKQYDPSLADSWLMGVGDQAEQALFATAAGVGNSGSGGGSSGVIRTLVYEALNKEKTNRRRAQEEEAGGQQQQLRGMGRQKQQQQEMVLRLGGEEEEEEARGKGSEEATLMLMGEGDEGAGSASSPLSPPALTSSSTVPRGYKKGSMGSTSTASLRTAGDFGHYSLDHVLDLGNVVFKDGDIHLYNLTAQEKELVESIDLKKCCLQINSPEVRGHRLGKVYHTKPLDTTAVCTQTEAAGEFSGASAFFLVPYHLDNFCHLLIDNLMALASNVLTAPHCNGQLPCQQESVLFRFHDMNLKGGALAWDQLFPAMFSMGQRKAHQDILTGGPYCVSHVSWGLGIKHLYHAYVSFKQDTMAAMRDWIMHHHHLAASSPLLTDQALDAMGVLQPGYPERRAKAGVPLRAVYIDRAPRPGSNRHFADYRPIVEAFERRGVQVQVVKDFGGSVVEQLRDNYLAVDIMIGLHGAGLTNAMFGRKGLVVVELKSSYGSAEVYRKIAQTRHGGYVMVPLVTPPDDGAHVIPPGLSDRVADCTLALFDMDGLGPCSTTHKGHVYAFERGHQQDCVWSGSSCLPEVIGLHYIPPPPAGTAQQ